MAATIHHVTGLVIKPIGSADTPACQATRYAARSSSILRLHWCAVSDKRSIPLRLDGCKPHILASAGHRPSPLRRRESADFYILRTLYCANVWREMGSISTGSKSHSTVSGRCCVSIIFCTDVRSTRSCMGMYVARMYQPLRHCVGACAVGVWTEDASSEFVCSI